MESKMRKLQENEISVEEVFQRSVNIRYDFGNKAKVQDYIASEASLELLKKLIWSTANHAVNRANILIGAYGRGKSHLILVLLTLLCARDRSSCESILDQINQYDTALYTYMREYISKHQRLLPIIISGNRNSISQSFLSALQEALQREQLEELMPDTHFHAALNMIAKWKEAYPKTYAQFIQQIAEPVDVFCDNLRAFNELAYKKFVRIFPDLTSGSSFNPFLTFDIVDLYSHVVDKLASFGYDGIFVVYDEFSKYLEANIKAASIADMKLLQDFAEKCTRSSTKQMHLLLITHKDIHNYIDLLPKEKTDGWRGISERFEHLEMGGDVEQTYELIGKVIRKNQDYYATLKQKYEDQFSRLWNDVMDKNLFACHSSEQIKSLIDDCYPLHPVTVFLLPRISEKVAQNERTLFTFLAADQKYTLKEYLQIQNQEFNLLTPDYIFDYFEQQFKKEAYQTHIHKIYITAMSALMKIKKGSLQEKLIKTLALIAICNEFELLPMNDDSILLSYHHNGYSEMEIAEDLTVLLKELHVLYRQENSGFLILKDGLQQDMERLISDHVEKMKVGHSVVEILNHALEENYFYPTKYNDDIAITRYFKFEFISQEALLTLPVEETADGMIYGIVLKDENSIGDARTYLVKNIRKETREIFVLPKEYQDINDKAYRYQAITELIEKFQNEDGAREELLFQKEDLEIVLRTFFFQYTVPEQLQAEYYYDGQRQDIYRKTQFTNLLSRICWNTFKHTPIINNEMINKDVIQKAVMMARNKIVNGLLETYLEPMLGLTGNGPEVSLTRVLLVNTGILEETEDGVMVRTHGLHDRNLQYVFDTILHFLKQTSENKQSNLQVLYHQLTRPDYRIGLKKGVIPVFLAAVFHNLKTQVIIGRQGQEMELTAELLASINETPEVYEIYLAAWDQEKQQFVETLESIFADFVVEREKQLNGFIFVYKAMQRWFLNLPKVTKNITQYFDLEKYAFVDYTPEMFQIIHLFRNADVGAKKFLFDDLPAIWVDKNLKDVVNNVNCLKKQLDDGYLHFIEGLLYIVKKTFLASENLLLQEVSVQSIWQEWYEENKKRIANASLSNQQERMISLLQQEKTEQVFIQELAKQVIGLRIIDWKDAHKEIFEASLKELRTAVESAEEKNIEEITIVQESDVASLSKSGQLLLKDLKNVIENDFGEAVPNREKRIVLAALLKLL